MITTLPAGAVDVSFSFPDGDHIGQVIERTGTWYEAAMLEDVRKRAPRGLAIDVGACFGTHSAWFAAACGMRVLALEPNEIALRYLRRNVEGLDVEVLPVAAGHREGRVLPRRSPRGNLGATTMQLLPRNQAAGPRLVTIDSLEGIEDVGLIKIDVEGFELRVLEGAAETIRRWQPLVYVEATDAKYRDVAAFMRGLGYRQFGRFNATPTYGWEPIAGAGPLEPALVSVAIMAHHDRERHIPYLLERMRPDVPVVWDEKQDRWDTGRRAMLEYDPAASHHLVVQDDALLPRDFLEGVARAAATVPDNPISFYTGRVRPNHRYVDYMVARAQEAGVSWAAFEGPWWGPAVAIPTRWIEEMVAWCEDPRRAHIANYDRRMSRFFLQLGVDCWYSVPSLVSHRTGPENPSLVPGRGSGEGRVAFNFIGESASALDVDWTTTAVWPDRRAPGKVSP